MDFASQSVLSARRSYRWFGLVEGEEAEVTDQVMIIITRTWRGAKSCHNLEKQAKSKV